MSRVNRRQRIIDRSYIRQGKQYSTIVQGEKVWHKARHVFNCYTFQRDRLIGTNHDRMVQRKINREGQRIKI